MVGSIHPREDKYNIICSQNFIINTTHKYGIEFPTTIEEAININTTIGNHLWRDAIDKDILNVGIAFELLAKVKKSPPGYKKYQDT